MIRPPGAAGIQPLILPLCVASDERRAYPASRTTSSTSSP